MQARHRKTQHSCSSRGFTPADRQVGCVQYVANTSIIGIQFVCLFWFVDRIVDGTEQHENYGEPGRTEIDAAPPITHSQTA